MGSRGQASENRSNRCKGTPTRCGLGEASSLFRMDHADEIFFLSSSALVARSIDHTITDRHCSGIVLVDSLSAIVVIRDKIKLAEKASFSEFCSFGPRKKLGPGSAEFVVYYDNNLHN